MILSEILKERRKELGLTQQEVADKMNVARQTVSGWETAKNYPDIPTLVKLGEYYDLSLNYMLKGDSNYMKKIEDDTNELYSFRKIRWRFGILGSFLYKRFSSNFKWGKKGFVFFLYSGTFLLFFGFISILLSFFVSALRTFPYILSLLMLSGIYGLWAHDFYRIDSADSTAKSKKLLKK